MIDDYQLIMSAYKKGLAFLVNASLFLCTHFLLWECFLLFSLQDIGWRDAVFLLEALAEVSDVVETGKHGYFRDI